LAEENATLREENQALRHYVGSLKELHWATQEIVSEENLFSLLDKILHSAIVVVGAEDGSLLLLDEETNELVFVLVHGDIRHELRGYRIPGEAGIAGWMVSHREPLIINNPAQDWRFSHQVDTTFGFSTRSLIGVPMIARGKIIGVIELLNKHNNEEFTETDLTLLSILGQSAATALDEMQNRFEIEEAQGEAV
jgi:GAF domain-containing protein